MSDRSIPYLYQLQNADFESLISLDYTVAVIDIDDAGLTHEDLALLQLSNKVLFSYVSIGEAENYRDYWQDQHWDTDKPDYVLTENPHWEGNFHVKFWDPEWQEIILQRIEKIVLAGYDGAYLDIVDGYTVDKVIEAYDGADVRQEMIDYVVKISTHAKSMNPDFKIIPQNGIGLLSVSEEEPDIPNLPYLEAIDGVGKEDTWYDDDNEAEWAKHDLEYLKTAIKAGKFVLSVDYPLSEEKQDDYIAKAIEAGFIPFIGNRELDGAIDEKNFKIQNYLEEGILQKTFKSRDIDASEIFSNEDVGFDFNRDKDDRIIEEFIQGIDKITIDASLKPTITDVVTSILYLDGNAIVDLGGGNTIIVMGVPEGSLTESDFILQ